MFDYSIRKLSYLLLLLSLMASTLMAQDLTGDVSASDETVLFDSREETDEGEKEEVDLEKMQAELKTLKKDVEDLKKKTSWFNFKFEGSVKSTFGLSLWARWTHAQGYPYIDRDRPLTYGFDFENTLKMTMNLNNLVVFNKNEKFNNGTEISVKIKMLSMSPSTVEPTGRWYMMNAEDESGNQVKVYFPNYGETGSNMAFGQFQFVFEEARVRRILGTGFYINYDDVLSVHKYYGVDPMTNVLTLNHKYFNNGYLQDRAGGINDRAALYYAFDDKEYTPKSKEAEAVRYWSNSMLFRDPANPDTNQKPHGFSLGFEEDLSKNVYVKAEAGIASKDSFDPKYHLDSEIDIGFYVRGEAKLYKKNNFSFHPKLNLAFAFQTMTTADADPTWFSFSYGLGIPFKYQLPTGEKDYIELALNTNLATNYHLGTTAFMLSFDSKFNLLDNKLYLALPVQYSFKDGKGGFFRVGDERVKGKLPNNPFGDTTYVKLIDQLYETHIVNLGFEIGFDSNTLFGHLFQYKVKNSIYFSYMQPTILDYRPVPAEIFFYEILENDFIFHTAGAKITLFLNGGYGMARNARVIHSDSSFVYSYDVNNDQWNEGRGNVDDLWVDRWEMANVFNLEVGMVAQIVKNVEIGVGFYSPKLLAGARNPVGNQNSFGTFKIWTELKF